MTTFRAFNKQLIDEMRVIELMEYFDAMYDKYHKNNIMLKKSLIKRLFQLCDKSGEFCIHHNVLCELKVIPFV